MDQHNLDPSLAPTGGPAWTTDLINGDHFSGGSSSPAAVAGYPDISVPAGMVFGLPVGISFFGEAWSEGLLIQIAYAFEQATKARRAPRFFSERRLLREQSRISYSAFVRWMEAYALWSWMDSWFSTSTV